jgi:hypothetical protein
MAESLSTFNIKKKPPLAELVCSVVVGEFLQGGVKVLGLEMVTAAQVLGEATLARHVIRLVSSGFPNVISNQPCLCGTPRGHATFLTVAGLS